MQQVAGMTQQGQSATPEEIISSLQQVNERMSQVAENAGKLASDAEAQDFSDVARDADSLRQQLLSARNRANLLQQKLHPASA
jgi:single-stranded DNA-specific DHH superfamily exonuclease